MLSRRLLHLRRVITRAQWKRQMPPKRAYHKWRRVTLAIGTMATTCVSWLNKMHTQSTKVVIKRKSRHRMCHAIFILSPSTDVAKQATEQQMRRRPFSLQRKGEQRACITKITYSATQTERNRIPCYYCLLVAENPHTRHLHAILMNS